MSVYVYLAEGFEEMEAVTPVDLLRRAGIQVKTVSVTGQRLVMGAHGVGFQADLLFEEAPEDSCEMILLPGGMPGTLNLQAHKGLTDRILRFAEQKKWLAAICAAPLILGELGILKGKRAVCYPGKEESLQGALLSEERVVRDGNVITSRGAGTAIDFGLELISVLRDREAAETVEKAILLRW